MIPSILMISKQLFSNISNISNLYDYGFSIHNRLQSKTITNPIYSSERASPECYQARCVLQLPLLHSVMLIFMMESSFNKRISFLSPSVADQGSASCTLPRTQLAYFAEQSLASYPSDPPPRHLLTINRNYQLINADDATYLMAMQL